VLLWNQEHCNWRAVTDKELKEREVRSMGCRAHPAVHRLLATDGPLACHVFPVRGWSPGT
jgi:hypothetical protein